MDEKIECPKCKTKMKEKILLSTTLEEDNIIDKGIDKTINAFGKTSGTVLEFGENGIKKHWNKDGKEYEITFRRIR